MENYCLWPADVAGDERIRVFQFREWFARRGRWAVANRLFWCHVAVGTATLTVISWTTSPGYDVHLRMLGTVLQAVGIVTVAADIILTRRDFGQSGFLALTIRWLRSYPDPVPNQLQSPLLQSVTRSMPGRIRVGPSPDASPLEALQHRVAVLDRENAGLMNHISAVQDGADNALAEHRSLVERQLQRLENKLVQSMTSNGALLGFGAFWLLVGVILGTIAPEVKCFIESITSLTTGV